jgi:arabinogalactan oligomer/maltooligosaccharide transport system permease protein
MSSRREMSAIWEPSQRALRRVLRGAASPRIAARDAENEALVLLLPPPPPAAPAPWLIGFGALLVALAAWAVTRAARTPVSRGSLHAWLWLLPAVLPLALVAGAPFAVGAGMSLFDRTAGHWTFVGGANFLAILTGHDADVGAHTFYFTLAVTILWTVANVALHVVIGIALALLLRDPLLKLRGFYRALLILPWAMPSYITALIWKGLFHRQLGAINALLALVGVEPVSWFARFSTAFCANLATNVWLGFPFMMVVALGALARIPRDLEDAAALDGASRWQRLRHVILPLLLPSMAPSIVLGAVWTFNMFNVVFLVSEGEPDGASEILVSQAYRWAFDRHHYGYAAAYAVLIFAVLALQGRLFRARAT